MVPEAGIEPARPLRKREILSLLCLPISPPGLRVIFLSHTALLLRRVFYHFMQKYCTIFGGANQSRTGLNGFAGRGITALLSRHFRKCNYIGYFSY